MELSRAGILFNRSEDELLAKGVMMFGEGKWEEIGFEYLPGRSGTSIKDRWRYLKRRGKSIYSNSLFVTSILSASLST